MNMIKATMKIYAVDQNTNHWRDNQAEKDISIQFPEASQDEINKAFNTMLSLGFGAIDGRTFIRRTKMVDLAQVQNDLSKFFKIELCVT